MIGGTIFFLRRPTWYIKASPYIVEDRTMCNPKSSSHFYNEGLVEIKDKRLKGSNTYLQLVEKMYLQMVDESHVGEQTILDYT